MNKTESLNIPLTDELKQFITSQAGNGTLYSTPSEYVRDLIRKDKALRESQELRSAIIEGYQDAIHGRSLPFSGDLRKDMKKFSERE